MKQIAVISVGGSLIVPEEVDTDFLNNFKSLILKRIKKGDRFILIVGGGRTCRKYQAALKSVAKPSPDDLDWIGIHTTWFNAELVKKMFGGLANPNTIKDPNKKVSFREKILIAGGWKPGRSTDDDAVRLAKAYGSSTIINLSNIDYVYDKDPHRHADAQLLESISWKDFRKIVGTKWNPGANVPFDPTAAGTAARHKLRVIITNGNDLKNLEHILEGKPFKGTTIK